MKLSPKALALSLGILNGLALFVLSLLAVYQNFGTELVGLLVGIAPYYEITLGGSFVLLVEGFIDGFIGGLLFGWIYNAFAPGSAT